MGNSVSRLRDMDNWDHWRQVTSVAYCADGRVLSGGSDSKLCLWNASGTICKDLTGHLGSVAKVAVSAGEQANPSGAARCKG